MMELLKDCLESSGSDSEYGDSGIVQGRVDGTAKKKTHKSVSPNKVLTSPEKKKAGSPKLNPNRNRPAQVQ